MASLILLPSPSDAVVWTVELKASEAQLKRHAARLSPDELARANRFVLPEIRERFILCRSALREILGRILGRSPDSLVFRYEKWGKPQLQIALSQPLQFNVSHSADRALIAIAQQPIGVDVEVPHDRVNLRAIVSQILSPSEVANWERLKAWERNELTLPLWVCKEALLKGLGLGIAEGLRRIAFELPLPRGRAFAPLSIDPSLQLHLDDDGSCRMTSWIDSRSWNVMLLDELDNCEAAVATLRTITEIHLQTFTSTI